MKLPHLFIFALVLSNAVSVSRAEDAATPPTKDQIALKNVYQLNQSMFGIYDNALTLHKKNIREHTPLILGLFTGTGGRFILYPPGKLPIEAPPVPPIYQLTKSVGHAAMATYELVIPYIGDPKANQAWVEPMKAYRAEVQTAQSGVADLPIKPEEKVLIKNIFVKCITFMDTCLKNGTYTYAAMETFARGVEFDCEMLDRIASAAQVAHWYEVLTEWKTMLGKDWDKTYALTNSIYVTRQNNILFSILVQFMGEKAINDRLLLLETTSFQTTPEDMLELFARITSDRGLAKVFFNNSNLMDHELLGWSARKAIAAEAKKRGAKAILPPLVPLNSNEWPMRTNPKLGSGPKSFDDLHEMGVLKTP
ncbi:MAG: hypothetical protein ABI615_03720 [Chthoniobacterales bacterium]